MKRWIIHFTALWGLGILAACAANSTRTPQQERPETEPRETTLKSGLKYLDLVVGGGREVVKGDTVDVQYSGWTYENGKRGKLFDTSIGGRPFTVTIGLTRLSWAEGLAGMKVGGKRTLIIPPDPSYGSPGEISGGRMTVRSDFIFEYEVELLDIPGHFDLVGPCALPGVYRRLALTGKQQDEFRRIGNWDALIDGARQDVRSDCSIPYRWEKLFIALVDGHRYHEALQVLNDVAMRRFPLPHAILATADPAFLAAEEFKTSEFGIEYAATETEIQQNMRLAESKLSSMDEKDRPPTPYRAAGACPFECCRYREWMTRSAVQLLESIGSATVVAEIPADARVDGVTGEVWVEPQPYAALRDNGLLKAGDVIFFLDNLGEGHVNYWYNGRLNPELELHDGLYSYTYENCQANHVVAGACSLRKLHSEKKFLNEWWVKIRTSDGKEGWVLNKGQFSNTDACG